MNLLLTKDGLVKIHDNEFKKSNKAYFKVLSKLDKGLLSPELLKEIKT